MMLQTLNQKQLVKEVSVKLCKNNPTFHMWMKPKEGARKVPGTNYVHGDGWEPEYVELHLIFERSNFYKRLPHPLSKDDVDEALEEMFNSLRAKVYEDMEKYNDRGY